MSNKNKFLSDYVYLAEASYANFSKGYDIDNVIKAISGTEDEGGVEKPENFAKLVTDNYRVMAHYTDREGDGDSSFSGTLFQNKESGDYVISMRGTQELATDLVAVDGGDIVFDGSAHRQIVDMYNFWMQIKNPQGEAYRVATMEVVEDLTARLSILQKSQWITPGVIDAITDGKIKELYKEAQVTPAVKSVQLNLGDFNYAA